jgi:CsoR family transcriptional regulator, copper-sensing transcriptional repressor
MVLLVNIGRGGTPQEEYFMAEKCIACDERLAHHTEKIKQDIVVRLNRVEGQIRGISKMVAEDTYCDSVLNQITSAEAALKAVRMLLLENHIKTCVVEQITQGKDSVVDELLQTISRMVKY